MLDVLTRKGQTVMEEMLESSGLHIQKQDDSFECVAVGKMGVVRF